MPTDTITFPSPAGQSRGYLARPEDTPAAPGIVVVQEWWGLVPHIEDVTRRFAAQGFQALAPDLYHGEWAPNSNPTEADRLMKALDWGVAAQELSAAVAWLKAHGSRRVGVVGFCMGGALALVAAAQGNVDAYVSFYGFPPPGGAPVDRIEIPGLIFFGENEDFFSVPDADSFARRQTARGRQTEVVHYPNAGHAFFNDTRPEAYQADAATDAWKRALAFLGEHLGG